MRVGELKDAMSDCLFQVEKYNKEKDEYEIMFGKPWDLKY